MGNINRFNELTDFPPLAEYLDESARSIAVSLGKISEDESATTMDLLITGRINALRGGLGGLKRLQEVFLTLDIIRVQQTLREEVSRILSEMHTEESARETPSAPPQWGRADYKNKKLLRTFLKYLDQKKGDRRKAISMALDRQKIELNGRMFDAGVLFDVFAEELKAAASENEAPRAVNFSDVLRHIESYCEAGCIQTAKAAEIEERGRFLKSKPAANALLACMFQIGAGFDAENVLWQERLIDANAALKRRWPLSDSKWDSQFVTIPAHDGHAAETVCVREIMDAWDVKKVGEMRSPQALAAEICRKVFEFDFKEAIGKRQQERERNRSSKRGIKYRKSQFESEARVKKWTKRCLRDPRKIKTILAQLMQLPPDTDWEDPEIQQRLLKTRVSWLTSSTMVRLPRYKPIKPISLLKAWGETPIEGWIAILSGVFKMTDVISRRERAIPYGVGTVHLRGKKT